MIFNQNWYNDPLLQSWLEDDSPAMPFIAISNIDHSVKVFSSKETATANYRHASSAEISELALKALHAAPKESKKSIAMLIDKLMYSEFTEVWERQHHLLDNIPPLNQAEMKEIGSNADNLANRFDRFKGAELREAILTGDLAWLDEILNELDENSDWVNLPDDEGNTPLHLAVLRNENALQGLLNYGTPPLKINVQNDQGKTPLYLAVEKQDEHLVSLLMDAAPNLTLKDQEGNTCLHIAASLKNTGILRILLMEPLPPHQNWQNIYGETALHIAAKAGLPDAGMILLEAGIDPATQDLTGATALHIVSKTGNQPLAERLMAIGGRGLLTVRNHKGFSARQIAAQNNHKAIIALLDSDRPTLQEGHMIVQGLEASVRGAIAAIKEKAPIGKVVKNILNAKAKCQYMLEAAEQLPNNSAIDQLNKLYQMLQQLNDAVVAQKPVDFLPKMEKELFNHIDVTKTVFQPFSVRPIAVAPDRDAIVSQQSMASLVDGRARQLQNDFPITIKMFEKALKKIQKGEYGEKLQTLIEDSSDLIFSQKSLLMLTLMEALHNQERIKVRALPELFRRAEQVEMMKTLLENEALSFALNDEKSFQTLLENLILFKEEERKAQTEEAEELQKLAETILPKVNAIVAAAPLSQMRFRPLSSTFIPAILSDTATMEEFNEKIDAGLLFEPELWVTKLPQANQIEACRRLARAYTINRNDAHLQWCEQFADRLSQPILKDNVLSILLISYLNRFLEGEDLDLSHAIRIYQKIQTEEMRTQLFEDAAEMIGRVNAQQLQAH